MADLQSYTINNFNGGISDLSNKGVRGAFKFGYGINLRNTSSALSCNQKLKKDSGSVVTDLIQFGISATDGNWYGFGNTGKIYKRNSGGAWSLEATDPDGEILGAQEYIHNDGGGNYVSHIVWATETKLKKVKTSVGFGTLNTIATFHNGYAGEYHTMFEALGVLLVCDADYILMLDYEGAINTQALQLPGGIYSKTLIDNGDIVIIGATEKERQRRGFLFTWNSLADSWLSKKDLQAQGANSLNFLEGGVMVQTGEELKYWDTVNLLPLKQIPGGGVTLPGAQSEYNSVAHFGVQGGSKNGVYGYGRRDKNSPFAMNLEYIPSHGVITDPLDKIGSVSNHKGEMLVSWYDASAGEYGVDIIDSANKAVALYQSLEIDAGSPYASKRVAQVKVVTRPLPDGTTVGVRAKTINDDDWQTCKTDSQKTVMDATGQKMAVFNVAGAGEGEIFEVELVLTPNGNATPEVISINNYYTIIGIY